jgi:hypothetical protein
LYPISLPDAEAAVDDEVVADNEVGGRRGREQLGALEVDAVEGCVRGF